MCVYAQRMSHCNKTLSNARCSEPLQRELCYGLSLQQEIFKGSSQWLTAMRDLFWLVIISHCHKRFSKARHSKSLQQEIFNGLSQWAAATRDFKGSSQSVTATRDFQRLVTKSHCHKRFWKTWHSQSLQREIFYGLSQWAAATRDF